jgi:hypothetical protein
MPSNDFLPFGTGGGANVIDQATYAALSARVAGFVAGVAVSAQLNKAWRQSSSMAAMIGQFIVDKAAVSATDDGDIATLETNFIAALRASVFQTSVIQPIIAQFQARGALAARATTAQSIPDNVETAVSFNTEIFDTDSVFSTTDPTKFYVPSGVSRVRLISQVLFDNNTTGSRKFRILKNGLYEGSGLSSGRVIGAASDDVTILNGSGSIYAASPGDYFQLMVVQTSGGALNIRNDGNTWMNMEILK